MRLKSTLMMLTALGAAATLLSACATPASQTSPSAAATLVEAGARDPLFQQPYIDVDEWRDGPVRHRYVHGGFRGTDTRFSFYFPETAQYEGRFFQHITPVPDSETIAQNAAPGEDNKIGFALSSGAYFVETNGGGSGQAGDGPYDPTIGAHRANAAAADYSRKLAQEMYGAGRPYGYAYGGSGGGFRTVGSIENGGGVWDGVVPYVLGSTMAIPNMFTVRVRAMRILGDKFPQVVDAADPGGSGDIYAGLTPLEAEALREVTQMGFDPRSWFGWKTMGIHGLAAVYQAIQAADPTYFTDFWTKPGYLGHDHPEQFATARLQHESDVLAPITQAEAVTAGINTDASSEADRGGVDTAFLANASERDRLVAFRIADAPSSVGFLGGDLVVMSGAAAGKSLPVARIVGNVVVLGVGDLEAAQKIRPGDRVRVDNSNFLALETFHRHQTPPEGFPVWDQFRNPDGTPIYPQRARLLAPGFVPASPRVMTGEFEGKMIVVESLWDREAMPWQGDWYRSQVVKQQSAQADANFRLWYVDHALHGDLSPEAMGEDRTRIVSYVPVLHQALRDLSRWVEQGVPPPASTRYTIQNGQVTVPREAGERLGVQPVISLTADGALTPGRVETHVGDVVTFRGTIAAPPGSGKVIEAAWDFDGAGAFDTPSTIVGREPVAAVSQTHRFERPGVYFVALRGIVQRDGDRTTPYARISNLERIRVVVR